MECLCVLASPFYVKLQIPPDMLLLFCMDYVLYHWAKKNSFRQIHESCYYVIVMICPLAVPKQAENVGQVYGVILFFDS